jgi:hypothetical protein
MHFASILNQYHDALQAKYGSRLLPRQPQDKIVVRYAHTIYPYSLAGVSNLVHQFDLTWTSVLVDLGLLWTIDPKGDEPVLVNLLYFIFSILFIGKVWSK